MLKLKYILIILMFLFIGTKHIMAGDVIIQLRQPPQYQFKLEHMWNVTLVNTSQTTYNVYLYGIATKSGEGKIVDANTSKFQLPPGTKIVQPQNISPINIIEAKKEYEAPVKHLGAVPNGNYDICVSVINAENGSVLGVECYTTEVLNLTQIELLSPTDGFNVSPDLSSDTSGSKNNKGNFKYVSNQNQNSIFPVFTWIPPVTAGSSYFVTYKLKITQMLGNQSSYDAMQSNPMFFSADNVRTTLYQYPVASRTLDKGKYAWQVEAYIDGVLMSQSEVWEFKTGAEISKTTPSSITQKWMRKQWASNEEYNDLLQAGS